MAAEESPLLALSSHLSRVPVPPGRKKKPPPANGNGSEKTSVRESDQPLVAVGASGDGLWTTVAWTHFVQSAHFEASVEQSSQLAQAAAIAASVASD